MHALILQLMIPNEWKDLLAKVQKIFPSAIIAGGALRDLDYEISPKDIDIFIESDENTYFPALDKIGRSVSDLETVYHIDLKDPDPFPEEYLEQADKDDVNEWNRNNRIHRKLVESKRKMFCKQPRKIYHLRRGIVNNYPVDFIFGCKNTCDINQFDLSICQISFGGTNIIKTDSYKKTEETGIVTVTNNITFKQELVDKFKLKFPDLEFQTL